MRLNDLIRKSVIAAGLALAPVYACSGDDGNGTYTCDDVGEAQRSCMNQPGWEHGGIGDIYVDSSYARAMSNACKLNGGDQTCIDCIMSAPCSPKENKTPLGYCGIQGICKD